MLKTIAKLACLVVVLGSAALARDLIRPAELPPISYAGQQYVDSKGCLFLRAGSAGKPAWVPRVTRQGEAVCGYPPSGSRVPVVSDGAAAPSVEATNPTAQDAVPLAPVVAAPATAGALLVAIGSFAVADNADRAERQITALGLPVHRGSVVRRGKMLATVFAGPFATSEAAQAALRSARSAGFSDAMIVKY
jgi:cell division septation protein DedD